MPDRYCWNGTFFFFQHQWGSKGCPGCCGSVGWNVVPYTKRSWIRFSIRAHAQVVGLIPSQGVYGRQMIGVSLSHWCFSLPFSLALSLKKKIKKLITMPSGDIFFKKRASKWSLRQQRLLMDQDPVRQTPLRAGTVSHRAYWSHSLLFIHQIYTGICICWLAETRENIFTGHKAKFSWHRTRQTKANRKKQKSKIRDQCSEQDKALGEKITLINNFGKMS